MTESTPGQNEWKLAFDVAVNALVRFDHPKAIENFRRAVELAEDSLPNSVSLAESLEGLGQSLWSNPDSGESEVFFRRANDIRLALLKEQETTFGLESLEVAQSLDGLARNYCWQKHSSEGIHCYQRALKIRIELLGEGHIEVVRTLERIASTYEEHERDRKTASEILKRALTILNTMENQSSSQDKFTTIQRRIMFEKLGRLAYEQEDYTSAEKCFQQIADLRGDQIGIDNISPIYARVLVRLKKFEDAERILSYAESHPRIGSGFEKFCRETRKELETALG